MNELSLLNSLLDGNCFGFPGLYEASAGYNAAVPKVDVQETKDSYILDMDMPGKTENDVDISLKDNVLTIASVKTAQAQEPADDKAQDAPKAEWLIRERRTTAFTRRFTLPKDIDSDAINASVKNGVLTITIPRKPLAAAKKIAISAA